MNLFHQNRRDWLKSAGALCSLTLGSLPAALAQTASTQKRVLILVELKGGNDSLNTVVPYADPLYRQLRPRIALADADIIKLDERVGLHTSLQPLMPLWQNQHLAIVQGLGYPQPNLSHFRSIEIWETASKSNQYLDQGWLTRSFKGPLKASSSAWTADGVVIGSTELGAFAGGARAVAMSNPEAFLRQSRLAASHPGASNPTLEHLLKVEADIQTAADGLRGAKTVFQTEFPKTAFGNAVSAAMQVLASQTGNRHIPVIHLQLGSFDTHNQQQGAHAGLLKQLADGLLALQQALVEIKRWDDTLVTTYSEFGRRPRENQSAGTDHGTAAAHFVLGGAVKGGLYGAQPSLAELDATGNMRYAIDFRQQLATVIERWWGVDSSTVLGAQFAPLAWLRA